MKVLSISPFSNYWKLHGQWESTVLNAMRLRGHEIRQFLCDGLFGACDLHFETVDPRDNLTCQRCQALSTELASSMLLPFEQLGRYLDRSDFQAAAEFSKAVSREEILRCEHGNWKLGLWCESSVKVHFRDSRVDFDLPRREIVYRQYLEAGFLACVATERILDDLAPDVVWLFNGRQAVSRSIHELCRARGTRVVTHERGYVPESILVNELGTCLSFADLNLAWEEWKDTPLSVRDLRVVVRTMVGRQFGNGLAWTKFSPSPQEPESVLGDLGLDPRLPILALFTSSDHEVSDAPGLQCVFPEQIDWVRSVVEYIGKHKQFQLVIRVHPNTAGKHALGDNLRQIREYLDLKDILPSNARIVLPEDPISTYTIIDIATLGLVCQSSVALEMACKGKPVLLGAGNATATTSFVTRLEKPEALDATLDRMLSSPADPLAIQTAAFRFAHLLYHKRSIPFSLVRMPDVHTGVLAYRNLEDLAPRRDANLDRICNVLEGVGHAIPGPTGQRMDAAVLERGFLEDFIRRGPRALEIPKGDRPKVSVIVPCYNYEAYLGECLDSVLAQTFEDWEAVVVDDGSTDGSLRVAREYESRHPGRIRVVAQPNCGQPAISRNNGIRVARGEYILPLDADDALQPDCLQQMVEVLESQPETAIVSGDMIASDGTKTWYQNSLEWDPSTIARSNRHHYACMYRRVVWETVGGYRTNVRGYEDWDFWIGCYEAGFSGERVPKTMLRYRVKADGLYHQAVVEDSEFRRRVQSNHPKIVGGIGAVEMQVVPSDSRTLGKALEAVRALTIRGDVPVARDILDSLERDWKGWKQVSQVRAEVETFSANAGELDPRIVAAERAISEGRGAEVLMDLQEASERWPDRARILSALGRAQMAAGNSAAAQISFTKVVELAPSDTGALADLAGVLMLREQPERAEPILRRLRVLHPEDPEIRLGLTRVLAAKGDLAGARREAGEFLSRCSDHPSAAEVKAFLARSAQARVEPPSPKIAVGVITHGKRPEKLKQLLGTIRSQDGEPVRILVAGELPVGFDTAGVEFVEDAEAARTGLVGRLRNRIVEHKDDADILIIVDDDILFHAGFLETVRSKWPAFEVMCPRILNPDGTRYWDWAVYRGDGPDLHFLLPYDQTDPDIFVTGGISVIRAEVFDRIRWSETMFVWEHEDADFSRRLHEMGIPVTCCPEAAVTHGDARHSQVGRETLMLPQIADRAVWEARNGRIQIARLLLEAIRVNLPTSGYPAELLEIAMNEVGNASPSVVTRKRIGYEGRTFCVPDSIVRGIGHYALHHLEALAALRGEHEIVVLVDRIDLLPEPLRNRIEATGAKIESWSARDASEYDLVHLADPMYVFAGEASPFQKFASNRLSATFYDITPMRMYAGKVANWPGYLARLDEVRDSGAKLLCISEFTRRDVLEATVMAPDRATTVMAGFNASSSGKTWSRAEGDAVLARLGIDKPFFLHVGAVDPHKNVESVLSVTQTISRQRPAQLVVAGKLANSVAALRDQVSALGWKDVVFTDFLSREELELLYSRAVATVFLSRYEGFGFPALEAMANGCPVVCSNATSLPEVVGDAALTHAPDDLEGVVRSLVRLMDDRDFREKLVQLGRIRSGTFSWQEVARKTWAVWEDLLAAPGPVAKQLPAPARVQWISPVWDPSGYGDESRAFVRHLASTDLGVGLLALGRHSETFRRSASPEDRKLFDGLMGRELARNRVAVLDIPGSGFGRVPGAGHHVGRTTFETDGLPSDWVVRCNAMDEIWVPCAFNRETFRKAGVSKPILVVPEGVDSDRFRPGLDALHLPGERRSTTFLAVFEWTHRKAPDLILRSWATAFGPKDDVRLVLRTYPANHVEGDPTSWIEERIDAELATVGKRRADCAPIVVLGMQIPEADMPRLYAAADAYLAPSRGEGWGRPHMEAMSCGVPVISTRWSGNLEFQDDDNSWLIGIDGLESIDQREEFALYRGQRWASPSPTDLVRLMKLAASDPAARKAKGAKARADVLNRWDWKRVGAIAEVRLREILGGIAADRSVLRDGYRAISDSASAPRERHPREEVRWVGPLFNYSGYARFGREAIGAIESAGMRATLDPLGNDIRWFEGLRGDAAALERWKGLLGRAPVSGTLVVSDIPCSADGRTDLLAQVREAYPDARRTVAWTMFESDRLPSGWAASLNRMDQVWVPSRHGMEAFANSGVDRKKLRLVPCGIDLAAFDAVRDFPMALPGPRAATTFLSVFQWSRRKGWDVLLEAWSKAFGPSDDVRLVLRCHPFGDAPSIREQLDSWMARNGLASSRMAPIVVLEDFLDEGRMPSLYAAADVFVLPSRGEGWGLPYLEAMAAGKPCIGTHWGAAAEFLHEGVGWMLPSSGSVPVDAHACEENPFLTTSHRWADPKVEDLVLALRESSANPQARREKGAQARRDVETLWTPAATAEAIRRALSDAPGRTSADSRSVNPGEVPSGPRRLSGILAQVAKGIRGQDAEPKSGNSARGSALAMPTSASGPGAQPLSIRWEGSQFVHHSLAHVNRELCIGLAKEGHDLSILPYEPDQFGPGKDPDLAILAQLTDAPLEGPCQVHVRHQWPPNLKAPSEGRWVVIQPWEFGSPPKDWMPAFRDQVDDLWAYTTHVREMYLRAGVPADRVHVVPLGVDCDRFRPGIAPLASLPPKQGVRFLYVGGTIARKGFDVLLNAWQKAFGPEDPVELLIKDMGGRTTYAGQTGESFVRKIQESGRFARIHYLNDDLPPSDLPSLYASGDVLVHPYRGEGFGLPIAEAMACGLPVVITKGGAADDFCGPDEAWMIPSERVELPGGRVGDTETVDRAWWLEPSEEALVSALREAALDGAGRAARGARARQRIEEGFTWAHAVAKANERLAFVAARPGRRSLLRNFAQEVAERSTEREVALEGLSTLLLQVESAVALQDTARADALSADAVHRYPDLPLAWLSRAMVLRGAGKSGKALEALGKSAELGGGAEVVYETMALHLQTGKSGPALTQWRILQDRHPDWVRERKAMHQAQGLPWLPDRLAPSGKGAGKKAAAKKR